MASMGDGLPVNFYGGALCRQCSYEFSSFGEVDDDHRSCESLNSGMDEHFHVDVTHPVNLLSGLQSLQERGDLCDVTLCVGESEFSCHKVVLVAFSPYFRAMFMGGMAESIQNKVTINGVEPAMIKLLIEFAYTSELTVNKQNVQSLLSAANLLEILPVKEVCCKFMEKNLEISNCIGIQCFAESHVCPQLQQRAMQFTLESFPSVSMQDEFLNVSCTKLIEIISKDELNVENEEFVYDAAMRWIQNDMDSRKEDIGKIMEHVRLPLMSPYFLHDCIESNELVMSVDDCRKYVNEAKTYQLLKDRRSVLQTSRTRPRKCDGVNEILVAVGGEDDKVVLRSVESYCPNSKRWKALACLPFAISKHGLVVSGNNNIYLAGGEFPDGTASKMVWQYNPSLDIWSELAPMCIPRSELGLAMLDGFMYAVGGWEGAGRIDTVEKYNPQDNSWSFVQPMNIAVTSPAVVACDSLLYVAGGAVLEDGDGIDIVQAYNSRTNTWSHKASGAVLEDGDGIDIVQAYNPRTNTWSHKASMLIPRSGSVACVLNSLIYVIGGWHASTENTDKVECYNPMADEWTMKSTMHERRYRPGVSVIDGCIYVCGGEEGWDKYHDSMERYDAELDLWEVIDAMPTSRSWLSCVTITCRTSHEEQRKKRLLRPPLDLKLSDNKI